MEAVVRSRVASPWWPVGVVVLAAFLPSIGSDHPAASLGSANTHSAAMKTFVIIFRQGSRVLTETEKQRRAEETTVWARRHNEAGHKLDPRILALESAHRGPDRDISDRGDARPITALLFLEATHLGEAVQIAEAHPALRYGANVEVRGWAPPAALPTGTR